MELCGIVEFILTKLTNYTTDVKLLLQRNDACLLNRETLLMTRCSDAGNMKLRTIDDKI